MDPMAMLVLETTYGALSDSGSDSRAKLANAPFIKVEATKFTEVGYVGRDVEQIIRDLVDSAIVQTRDRMRDDVKTAAHQAAEEMPGEAEGFFLDE